MLEIDLQLAKVGFCLILIIRHIQGRAEQGGVAGGVTPPTSLKFGYLTKCVGKIFEPNIVGKFGVFYAKKTKYRILSIFSPAEIKILLISFDVGNVKFLNEQKR